MDAYGIVLAEENASLRERLRMVLTDVAELRVLGEAANMTDLLEVTARCRPDLVLMGLARGVFSVDTAADLKRLHPEVKLLILSGNPTREKLQKAMKAGIEGCLSKDDTYAELFAAIETVGHWGLFISARFFELSAEKAASVAAGH